MIEHFDKGGVMEYPVGSVCVVVQSDMNKHLIGSEVTIVEGLQEVVGEVDGIKVNWIGYITDVVAPSGAQFSPPHEYLRLKKLPPDEAFDAFLNKLTQPVEELA